MLNIKNPRAHQLAKEVSRLTGENLTDAVIHSLEERLERTPAATVREIDMAKVEETLAEIRRHLPPEFFEEEDPTSFLYDPETGLPA